MQQIRFTKEGYEKLKKDYEDLLKTRPDAVEHLKKARDMGDLSENGYYKASKSKLSFIDVTLRKLSWELKQAVIIETKNLTTVDIGNKVTLNDGKKEIVYQIVGDLEANPSQGKLSLLSPLGRAIAGKQVGANVEIITPAGTITYKITTISA